MLRKLLRRKGFPLGDTLPWFRMMDERNRPDYRGVPTSVCPCGNDIFVIAALFDDDTREPGMYMLDGVCAHCGAIVTVPCPVDDGNVLRWNDGLQSL